MSSRIKIERKITDDERRLLQVMAKDIAVDERTRKKARALLAFLETGDLAETAKRSGLGAGTISKTIRLFNERGWQSLLTVKFPRGGDFLSRYDQGYWAERMARAYLDNSRDYRAIPYGTSRSEPFTDLNTFREYIVSEFLLQSWSAGGKWKRPDLLLVPRLLLQEEGGTDAWTPDLRHWDNERCARFVAQASAAVEVETSLWQVNLSTIPLSFTVKEEDLESLRNWAKENRVPLYILQVFYDEAHVLPFSVLEFLIGPSAPLNRKVKAKTDRITGKSIYMIPLTEGIKIGNIPEPGVEGRVFKAPNGRVTVYGRLIGSYIESLDQNTLDLLAGGKL